MGLSQLLCSCFGSRGSTRRIVEQQVKIALAQPLITQLLRRQSRGLVVSRSASSLLRNLQHQAQLLGATLVPKPDQRLGVRNTSEAAVQRVALSPDLLGLPERLLLPIVRRDPALYCLRSEDGSLLPECLLLSTVTDASERRQAMETRLRLGLTAFEQAVEQPMERTVMSLGRITLHPRLGTLLDKVKRLKSLASALASRVEPALEGSAKRAALLSKTDLLSPLVVHYPELRGYMGAEVALRQGEGRVVAESIASQYAPRDAADGAPLDALGSVLQLADRLDTLSCAFAFGVTPTPTTDPLQIRRQGAELLATLIARRWPLSLFELAQLATARLDASYAWLSVEDTQIRMMGFLRHRLRLLLRRTFADDDIHQALHDSDLVPYRVHQALLPGQSLEVSSGVSEPPPAC